MKKLLALLCALTLLLSLGITAFAVDGYFGSTATGTQTITVSSPALTWNMEIPADITIQFGAEESFLGEFKISNVSLASPPNLIYGWVNYDGKLTGSTYSMNYAIECEVYTGDGQTSYSYGNDGPNRYPLSTGQNSGSESLEYGWAPAYFREGASGNSWMELYVKIEPTDWAKAVPGVTYTGKVIYSSAVRGYES